MRTSFGWATDCLYSFLWRTVCLCVRAIKKNNNNFFIFIQFFLILGGYIAPSQVLKFFACALAILLYLTKMNRDVLEQVYIFVINKSYAGRLTYNFSLKTIDTF